MDGLRTLLLERCQYIRTWYCWLLIIVIYTLITLDCFHGDYDNILQSGFLLINERIELDFNELVKWDIDALSIDFATWMAVDNVSPAATSRVGILSSVECQGLLLKYLHEDLCTSFRLLIKASSLLYNHKDHPHPHYDHEQLNLIRSSAGARLLVSLETALKNTALAKASKEKLMSLFLVLLGAIIAITYTPATGFGEARYELLRILAHHMIFIAERIDLVDCDLTKQRLTASCHSLWDKTGNFDWNYTVDWLVEGVKIGISPEVSPYSCGLSSVAAMTMKKVRALFLTVIDHQMGDISIAASRNPLY